MLESTFLNIISFISKKHEYDRKIPSVFIKDATENSNKMKKNELEEKFIENLKTKLIEKKAKKIKIIKKNTEELNAMNTIPNIANESIQIRSRNIKDPIALTTEPSYKTKGISFDKYSDRKGFIVKTNSPPILTYIKPKNLIIKQVKQ